MDTPKKVAMARKLYDDENLSIADICKTLRVSRATLSLSPDPEDDGGGQSMSAPVSLRLPQPLRSRKVQLDNLTLLPASLLPQKASWQALANRLPVGATLIILPYADTPQRKILEKVARNRTAPRSEARWRGCGFARAASDVVGVTSRKGKNSTLRGREG